MCTHVNPRWQLKTTLPNCKQNKHTTATQDMARGSGDTSKILNSYLIQNTIFNIHFQYSFILIHIHS